MYMSVYVSNSKFRKKCVEKYDANIIFGYAY